MLGICLEQGEIFIGQLLYVLRESLVVFPKRRQRNGSSWKRREIVGVDFAVDLLQYFLVLASW